MWNQSTAQESQDSSSLKISRFRLYRQEDEQGRVFFLLFLIRKFDRQPPKPLTLKLDNVTQHCTFTLPKVGMINEEVLGNT